MSDPIDSIMIGFFCLLFCAAMIFIGLAAVVYFVISNNPKRR